MEYAGFWKRFGAYWIDVLIWIPIVVLMTWLGGLNKFVYISLSLLSLIIGVWFHVYLVKKYGGTPGKLLMKIKITKIDGSPVGYREAVIRYSVLFLLTILSTIAIVIAMSNISNEEYYSLGWKARSLKLIQYTPFWYAWVDLFTNVWVWSEFVVMLTNKQRRSVHDFMAGTVVIKSAN